MNTASVVFEDARRLAFTTGELIVQMTAGEQGVSPLAMSCRLERLDLLKEGGCMLHVVCIACAIPSSFSEPDVIV